MTQTLSRALAVSAALVATLPLGGCGTTLLSGRASNPVIQDFTFRGWSKGSTLATTSSRRLALMVYKPDKDGREALFTCAEPPPDVGETFAKAVAAQLEVSGPVGAGEARVGAGYANEVATAIAPLLTRTQGLQVMRDSAYTLCVDHLNGWIDDAEYIRTKNERFDKALELIRLEIPMLQRPSLDGLAAPKRPPPAELREVAPPAPAPAAPASAPAR